MVNITKILLWLRNALAHYIKDIYRFHKLGKKVGGSCISIDESYFIDDNGKKIWIIGTKNNITSKLRLDVYYSRNENDCKIFILNHIKPKNIIITDGWSSYQFLDDPNFENEHEVHVHGPSINFGFGSHSTSHIEGIWGTIKEYIKKIYNYIPCKNFIFYLREAEFRSMIHDLNPGEKRKKKYWSFRIFIW